MLKTFPWLRRISLLAVLLGLLATNVLTLTSTACNAALSGLVGTALGVRTVSSMMQTKIASQDRTIKKQAAIQATLPTLYAIWNCQMRVRPGMGLLLEVVSGWIRRGGLCNLEFYRLDSQPDRGYWQINF